MQGLFKKFGLMVVPSEVREQQKLQHITCAPLHGSSEKRRAHQSVDSSSEDHDWLTIMWIYHTADRPKYTL